MTTYLTPNQEFVHAGASRTITATLSNEDNSTFNKAAVTAATLTIKDSSGNVINSRNAQSVLDENGGTLDASGLLTIKLYPEDNVFVGTTGTKEVHWMKLRWTWLDEDLREQAGVEHWAINVHKLEV